MRKAFAAAAVLVSSSFALTMEKDNNIGQTLAQPEFFPTSLAMTQDGGDAVDISDYVAPEDDGTWAVQGEENKLPKIKKKIWKWLKKKLEEAKERRKEECDDSECDDDSCDGDDCDGDKCDPNDSDCDDDSCNGDDCDDDSCDGDSCEPDQDDSCDGDDCNDDSCDGDSCDPNKDDSCDGDDCNDDSCDGDSCDPDQDDSAPSCENVMHKPQSEEEYNALVDQAGSKPILVKFGTESCGACRHVKDFTEQLAKDTDCRSMMFIDGDLNKIGKAWYPYKLQYIPTFVVLIDGEQAAKEVTSDKNKIQALVNNYKLSEDEYCDDCDDETCDGDSCEPEQEDDSAPSCENVMHKPQSEEEYNALVDQAGSKPILVKFGTESCGACRSVKDFTEQLAKDTDCRSMMFIDGDLNKIGKAWYPYKLQYIPTFVVLIDDEQAAKEVTSDKNKIQALVDNYKLSEDEYCDDCDDDTCDGDSCEPDQEESEPSCENKMLKPQSQAEYEAFVEEAGATPIMVKFGTQSCGACKAVKDFTEQLAQDTDCRTMRFIDGDLNKIGSAWYPYKLKYIPTFVILTDGVEAARKVTSREADITQLVSDFGIKQTSSSTAAQLSDSTMMQKPQSAEEFDEMIASAGDVPVQVKFTMNDCEACDYCEESSESISASVDSSSMQFIEANINLVGEVRYRYDINAVPTFIVVQKGREISGSRIEGGHSDQIENQVEQYSL